MSPVNDICIIFFHLLQLTPYVFVLCRRGTRLSYFMTQVGDVCHNFDNVFPIMSLNVFQNIRVWIFKVLDFGGIIKTSMV